MDPVEEREALGPPKSFHVLPELGLTLNEVGEVRVRQRDEAPLALLLGNLDVLLRQLVPDAAAPRVQEQPHAIQLVERHLDEVIA
jgi:hypothetical protein